MNFKFHTSRSSLPTDKMPPQVQKIFDACTKMADGDLVDGVDLYSSCGVNLSTIKHHGVYLGKVRHVIKQKAWYGNPSTIAELKKKFPR